LIDEDVADDEIAAPPQIDVDALTDKIQQVKETKGMLCRFSKFQ
jgi:hypothetical protein